MKRENILIVDDEALVREMMRDMLDEEGYSTVAVESGKSALRIAQEANFDLLLADIRMPGMDGLELVQQLRQRSPGIVPILVTGYASVATARKAIQEGVYDYIVKPFDRSELTAAVEGALSRKRLADENARLRWLFGILQVAQAVAAGEEYHQLLEFIVRTAMAETKSTGGSIVLFELAVDGVTIAAAVGRWDYAAQIANTIVKRGVASFKAQMGRCLLLTDREQHPLFELLQCRRLDSELWAPTLRGAEVLLLPMEVDKETTGIFSICRESGPEPLSEGDLELLRILAAEAGTAVRNQQSLSKVEGGCLTCLRSIASQVDEKSVHANGHTERVAHLSRQLASRIGMTAEEVELVGLAASLHDLGKIGIGEAILNNVHALSGEEQNLLMRHPVIADEILAPLQFLSKARAIIRHHHERLDGEGYPDGLSGQEITPAMHVVILANAYDNLTLSCARGLGVSQDEALLQLQEGKGTRFSPEITDSFVAMMKAGQSQG